MTLTPDLPGGAEPGTRNNQFAQLAYDRSQIARYMEGAYSRQVSDALMREIYLRDNGTCQKCSRPVGPRAAHFDHVIPWSEDGDTVPWNLQVLCESCNLAKGNRMDDQDYNKLAELNAFTWSLYALECILTEYLKYIRDFASLNDTQRSAVRRVVRHLRELADDIERAAGGAVQELAPARRPDSARPRL